MEEGNELMDESAGQISAMNQAREGLRGRLLTSSRRLSTGGAGSTRCEHRLFGGKMPPVLIACPVTESLVPKRTAGGTLAQLGRLTLAADCHAGDGRPAIHHVDGGPYDSAMPAGRLALAVASA